MDASLVSFELLDLVLDFLLLATGLLLVLSLKLLFELFDRSLALLLQISLTLFIRFAMDLSFDLIFQIVSHVLDFIISFLHNGLNLLHFLLLDYLQFLLSLALMLDLLVVILHLNIVKALSNEFIDGCVALADTEVLSSFLGHHLLEGL